jgi:hypothetical protein
MLISRLADGATIVSGSRLTNDSIRASINFAFTGGFHHDPVALTGVHHLLEHLINPPLRPLAESLDVSLNAHTGAFHLVEVAAGYLSPRAPDYGLWQLVAPLTNRFLALADGSGVVDNLLAGEKAAIKAEIAENYANQDWLVNSRLAGLALAPGNPTLRVYQQTPEVIQNATVAKTRVAARETFHRAGLVISVLNDGLTTTQALLASRLEAAVAALPPGKSRKIDYSLLDLMKPGWTDNRAVSVNTHLGNALVSICAVWPVAEDEYTTVGLALGRIAYHLSNRVFNLARRGGWAYSANAFLLSGDTKSLFVIRIDITKRPEGDLGQFLKIFQASLTEILGITDPELASFLETEKKRQQVLPVEAVARLNWAVKGLREFDGIIDVDKIRAGYARITVTHLKNWLKYFSETKPVIAVIGDL